MKKKFGVNIILGILVISIILGIGGIIYTACNSIYAANTREDFTFAIDNETGKVKVYDDLLIQESYGFNMVLPQGVKMQDVTLYEKNNAGLLKISTDKDKKPIVIGVKLGKGTLCAEINYEGKKYETSTSFEVIKKDFCFPIVDKKVKSYTGKNAFVINKENEVKLTLPTGYTMQNVELSEEANTGILNIDNDKKTVTGKKTGKGVLVAHLKGTDKYTTAEFEVIDNTSKTPAPAKDLDSDESNTKTTTKNTTKESKVVKKSISFNNEKRIVTYAGKDVVIYETPTTKGIKTGEITYSTTDSSIAEVSTNEKINKAAIVRIKKVGKVDLIASYNNGEIVAKEQLIIHSSTLDIYEKSKNNKLNNTTISLNVGETIDIFASENQNKLNNVDLSYTSSNGKICSIDENGKITAKAKGSSTIKVMLKENNKSYGQIKVKVSGSAEEKMLNEEFSFPKDAKTGKVIEAKGENALIVGKTYTYDLVKPKGAENYEVTYKCSKNDLLKIDGSKITPLKAGKGILVAEIKIAGKTKTTSMNFEVYANENDKNNAASDKVKYINVNFDKDSMVVEKGNAITLKPVIDTNMTKKEYELVWTSSDENVAKVDKNGRVTPVNPGNTYITVGVKNNTGVHSTMKLEVKEKVVLVSSLKFKPANLEKKGSTYLIRTNEVNTMNFEVTPNNATNQDYYIEVDDKENFMVQGKNVVALKEGVKTKLTARSLDSGNKYTTITLESVLSSDELSNLQLISENKSITVKVGETLRFRNEENGRVSKTGNNFLYKVNDELITITGNKIGNSKLNIKVGNKTISIPVNVVAEQLQKNEVPVKNLELEIDPETSRTKDYSIDHPLVINKCYNVASAVSVYPDNATNKSLNVDVSDKEAFTITADGNLIANKENASAIVTLSSVSNPEVTTSFKVSSTAAKIKSIKFAKDYVGENTLTTEHNWGFNLYITLDNGYTFDPVATPNIQNNEEYMMYRNQIKIVSNNTSVLKINSDGTAEVVKGKNGEGVLKAYVINNPSISAQTLFKTEGITTESSIKNAKFAKKEYTFSLEEGSIGFCPIITLENGKIFDPSLDYGKPGSVATTEEYLNYLSQLELVTMKEKDSSNIIAIENGEKELKVIAKGVGSCAIGVQIRGTNRVFSKAQVSVVENDPDYSGSNSNVTANIKEVDHNNTTSNRNLNITNIQFAKRSYDLTDNWSVGFHPIITLSDGTKISENSKDQDTYFYYVGLTQIYLTNDSNNKNIDFGVMQVVNNKVPSEVIPLKNGSVNLAIGLRSNGMTYDVVPVTVKIQ